MAMTALPDVQTLAKLISNVTQMMCGFSFTPFQESNRVRELCWRMAIIAIPGVRFLNIAISSDQGGCAALGAAILGCSAESLDDSMIDDSLCEILNMAAGQIKRTVVPDQELGLPKIVKSREVLADIAVSHPSSVLLKSQGAVDLVLWISEVPLLST
jgi:hypothetical protein